jgi:hypothetical protein
MMQGPSWPLLRPYKVSINFFYICHEINLVIEAGDGTIPKDAVDSADLHEQVIEIARKSLSKFVCSSANRDVHGSHFSLHFRFHFRLIFIFLQVKTKMSQKWFQK